MASELPTNWLTIPQAAATIGVSAETMRCLCHRRELRHIRTGTTGRAVRIRPEWIQEYLDAKEVAPSEGSLIAAAARKRAVERMRAAQAKPKNFDAILAQCPAALAAVRKARASKARRAKRS